MCSLPPINNNSMIKNLRNVRVYTLLMFPVFFFDKKQHH